MFGREILIGITVLFAWVPSLILVFIALLGFVSGFYALVQLDLSFAIPTILLSIGGVLGFLSLTSLSWGLKLNFFTRLAFLLVGVLSLSSVIVIGHVNIFSWFKLGFSWLEFYFLYCPLALGILHIALHSVFLVRLPNNSIKSLANSQGQ